jgi:hypothetical protein
MIRQATDNIPNANTANPSPLVFESSIPQVAEQSYPVE